MHTQVVDDVGLAPFRPMRSWLICCLDERRIEQQVVEFVLAEPLERLLGKCLDCL